MARTQLLLSSLLLITWTVVVVFFAEETSGQYVKVLKAENDDRKCLHMTWRKYDLDITNPDDNITSDCYDPDNYPCKEPVWVKEEQPTADELKTWAEMYNNATTDNSTSAYCDLNPGYACVKYVYSNRDKKNLVENITMFCGRGVDESDGTTVLDKCHTQKLTGFKVEACFCTEDLCNTAPHVQAGSLCIVAAILITAWLKLVG